MHDVNNVRDESKKSVFWLILFSIVGASPAIGSLFDTSSYSYASPYIIAKTHLSIGYLGILISTFSLGIAIFSIIGGVLFDKFSAKYSMILGVSILSVFTVATGYSTNLIELTVSRLITGFGIGIIQVTAFAFLGDANPKTRGFSIMFYGELGAIGGIVAPYILAPFLPNYTIPFDISGIIGFIIILIFIIFIPNTFKIQKKLKNPLKETINKDTIYIILAIFFFGFTLLNILGYYAEYLEKFVGFGKIDVGIILSGLYIGALIFSLPGGYLSDKIGRKYTLIVFISLIVISTVGIIISGKNLVLFLLLTIIFGAGWHVYSVISPASGQDLVDDKAVGSVSGVIYFFYNIGGVIGPLLLAYSLIYVPFRSAMIYFMLVPALIAFGLTAAIKYPKNIKEIVEEQAEEK